MSSYLLLAKSAVESFIKEGERIKMPTNLPQELLEEKAGVFVTIEKYIHQTDTEQKHQTNVKKKRDQPFRKPQRVLRGCIGTYLPVRQNIAEEIIFNAIAAATQDCRFEPVREDELSFLSYTVSILGKLEPIKDISQLDPQKYGILVQSVSPFVSKKGILLPGIEGIDTIEKQFQAACQKAGIDPLREKVFVSRFAAKKCH